MSEVRIKSNEPTNYFTGSLENVSVSKLLHSNYFGKVLVIFNYFLCSISFRIFPLYRKIHSDQFYIDGSTNLGGLWLFLNDRFWSDLLYCAKTNWYGMG